MKKVTVRVREGEYSNLFNLIKESKNPFYTDKEQSKIVIYIPDAELDEAIKKLSDVIDLRYRENIIEVSTPDFVISPTLRKAEEKLKEEKTPVEKLIDSTKPYTKLDYAVVARTSIAGIIALIGLITNNVAILIGAMLLSPLLGPIYSFAINIAVGKIKNAIKSLYSLSALLGSTILLSIISAFILNLFYSLPVTSEIALETEVRLIYIPMALLLGFASILSITKGIPEGIAGVAIAAALLPPAVAFGLLIVILPEKALNALIVTFQSVLGLMAGSLLATIVLDIGPRKYYEKTEARHYIVRSGFVIFILLVFTSIISLIFV